jgi:MtN3 and saliva related transmembrane protein
MELVLVNIIAGLAVTFQSLRIIPQVYKGFKTKKVRDVSFLWEVIGTISTLLWLTYGFMITNIPIIIANIINLICYILLVYQKFIYD